MRIEFDKLPAQRKLFEDETTRIQMFSAGYGSGKTFLLCMKMLRLSYLNKRHSGGLMCPSYPDLKRDVIPTFEEILQKNRIPYRYHSTEKWFKFPWMGRLAKLYMFSAENRLVGPNLAYAGINEMSSVPKARFYETIFRVRVKNAKCPQIVLVGTPQDEYMFLEEFVQEQEAIEAKKPGSFKVTYANTTENIYIDEGYAETLRNSLDKRSQEVFLNGQIVRLGGDYFYYGFQPSKNVTDQATYNPDLQVGVGMDFNVGRMTATLWQRQGNDTWCFDEIVILGNSDTPQMCDAIKARYPVSKVILYPDASAKSRSSKGRSDLDIMLAAGFTDIRFLGVNPKLRDRQLMMNNRFEKGWTKINPKCKNLIKDLKSVKQKADFTKDKSVIELTHASDSMDYYHTTEYNFSIDRSAKTIRL